MNSLFEKLPENLQHVLQENGIEERHLSRRYSNLYIEGEDLNVKLLSKIKTAGPWSSLATTFISNISGKPCLEIPLALLDALVQGKFKIQGA